MNFGRLVQKNHNQMNLVMALCLVVSLFTSRPITTSAQTTNSAGPFEKIQIIDIELILDKTNLNQSQRQEAKKIILNSFTKCAKISQRINALCQELSVLLASEPFDDKLCKEKMIELERLESLQSSIVLDVLTHMKTILSTSEFKSFVNSYTKGLWNITVLNNNTHPKFNQYSSKIKKQPSPF